MLNWGPITYYTDVNSLVYNYYESVARNYTYFSNPINYAGKMNFSMLKSPAPYINFGGSQNSNYSQNFWGISSQGNNFGFINPFNLYSQGNLYNDNQYRFNYYDAFGFCGNRGFSYNRAYPLNNSATNKPANSKTQPPKSETKSTIPVKKEVANSVNKKDSVPANNVVVVHNKKTSNTTQNLALNAEFLKVANKYTNCKESDNSHLRFCTNIGCNQNNRGEWCTDFVSYIVKESYANKGRSVPSGFGTHDVGQLKNWAIEHNMFISTSNRGQKAKYIKDNIKPGDIFILNENGASHTGFVSQVHQDGSFSTIEGNRDDKVSRYRYSPDFNQLSGFIRMS